MTGNKRALSEAEALTSSALTSSAEKPAAPLAPAQAPTHTVNTPYFVLSPVCILL